MKKHYLFPVVVLGLAALSGCRVTEQEPSEKAAKAERLYPVHFVAGEIETRTVFGEAETADGVTTYPTLWTGNDSRVAVSLNLNGAKPATVQPSEDYRSATFDADFSQAEVTAPYVFYAVTPFSAVVGATSSHGGYHINILSEQTPSKTSVDEGAQVMAARQEAESISDFSGIELKFSHVTAYGKLTLKNMALPSDAVIQSIDLTASTPFAGQFYYNYAEDALEESSSSRTVTVKPDNLTFSQDGDVLTIPDIWFACAPADLSGGTLRIDVNTSTGILSRTLEIGEGKLAFTAGHISKFTVNMTSAGFTQSADRWVLVTDASTLAAGDEIIIASSATAGPAYAVSTVQNANNRGVASVTIARDSDGNIVVQNPGSQVEVLRLVAGSYTGFFYLQEATSTTGRYLYTTSSSKNNYLLSGEPSKTDKAYSNWKITITSSIAYVASYGSSGNYYKQLRYNSSSNIYSAYRSTSQTRWSSSTSGTSNIYIYRKMAGVNVDDDPILVQEEYGAYLSGNNHVYGAGNQLSREYLEDGTVTFAILSPATYEIAEFNGIPADPAKGDTFTLNYNRVTGRSQSDADYNVTVVKVDGPKVWLSAGSGNGFIVKK